MPLRVQRERVRLLSLTQASERVQLSRWTLRRAIERGELEGLRFGRLIRVSEQALEAWIADRLIEPSGPSQRLVLDRTNGAASKRPTKLAPNYFRQTAKEGISS